MAYRSKTHGKTHIPVIGYGHAILSPTYLRRESRGLRKAPGGRLSTARSEVGNPARSPRLILYSGHLPADKRDMRSSDAIPEPNGDYTLVERVPSVETYCRLRAACGMTPRSPASAQRGLAGTLYAVQACHGDEVVGMGRVIGDGGCFFQVTDIAVRPAHRRRGVGHQIMQAVTDYLVRRAPADAFVSLIADGDSPSLYRRFGFLDTAPASIVMRLPRRTRAAWRRDSAS